MQKFWANTALFLLLLTCACIPYPVSVSQSILKTSSNISHSDTAQFLFDVQGTTLNEDTLQTFLIQKIEDSLPNTSFSPPVPGHGEHTPQRPKSPTLVIDDVVFTDSGESIMGNHALAAIQPDLAGKQVGLTLKGLFRDKNKSLDIKAFRFTYAPPPDSPKFCAASTPISDHVR